MEIYTDIGQGTIHLLVVNEDGENVYRILADNSCHYVSLKDAFRDSVELDTTLHTTQEEYEIYIDLIFDILGY